MKGIKYLVCYREVEEYMRERERQGATCVLLAAAQSLIGAFAIKDPLKPEVPKTPIINKGVHSAISPSVLK